VASSTSPRKKANYLSTVVWLDEISPRTLIAYLFITKGDLNFWREMLVHVKQYSFRESR
jgi:hypothetical protein